MQKYKFSKLLSLSIQVVFIIANWLSPTSCIRTLVVDKNVDSKKVNITSNDICKTSSCRLAAKLISEKIDKTIDPCDNFYRFACGKYIENSSIEDDSTSFSVIDESYSRLYQKLKISIEKPIKSDDPRVFQLLKSYYKICSDIEKIEKFSVQKLEEILNELGGWPVVLGESWNESTFDWKYVIYKLRRIGYSYSMNSFVSFEINVNEKNNSEYAIILDQASLGLEMDYLLRGVEDKIVKAYYEYTVSLATILGADVRQAGKELAESLNFEMELSKISSTAEERKNNSQLYNPMSVKELQSNYPGIPWSEYLNEMLKPHFHVGQDDKIIMRDTKFFKHLFQLLSRTPKRVLANYLIYRVVQESTIFMNNEIRQIEEKLSASISGEAGQEPRWLQCIDYLYWELPLATGAFYVKNHFDKNLKNHVGELANELRKNFGDTLKKTDWMDEKTKKVALKKLKSIQAHIAYPVELFDNEILDKYFEDLKIVPEDYLRSHLNLNLFNFDKMIKELGKPANKTSWFTHGSSATINAFYKPTENSIDIYAGYMQEELFVIDRPKYMNYAGLGSVIGHELNHAFDDDGIQYDEEGNLSNCWDPKMLKEYQKRLQCIVDQYNNYTVAEIGLNINGLKTLEENMADIEGIKQAYFAYEEYEKQNGVEPRLPGLPYTIRQLFWISAAQIYCEKYQPEDLEDLILTGVYSPAEFRVIGSFSNMLEFSRDFECSVGSRMNPTNKCGIW